MTMRGYSDSDRFCPQLAEKGTGDGPKKVTANLNCLRKVYRVIFHQQRVRGCFSQSDARSVLNFPVDVHLYVKRSNVTKT